MKYETTAKRIRYAMDRKSLSQQELADKSQIGKSSISHYVNGTNEPGNKTAYVLAQALDVNPAWLMGFDAPMEPDVPLEKSEFDELFNSATPEIQQAVLTMLKAARHDP